MKRAKDSTLRHSVRNASKYIKVTCNYTGCFNNSMTNVDIILKLVIHSVFFLVSTINELFTITIRTMRLYFYS